MCGRAHLTTAGDRSILRRPASSFRRLTLLAALPALAVLVPQRTDAQLMKTETTAGVRRLFVADLDSLQARFLALANAIPDEKYSWRPAPGVRSIGETFLHVASQYYLYTPMA